MIQKRAVRILTGSKYNYHTEPLFKQTNLLKVNDICKLNEIKFYYKLVNKQQPQYFNSFTHETNSDIHSHNTCRRNELHIPKTKHDFAKTNLRYRILQTINLANLFVEKCIRSSWRLCACAGWGAGTAGRGSVVNFSLSICLSWSPGAYGGMVLGAVRAWLLGRAVANLPTQYCKHEV